MDTHYTSEQEAFRSNLRRFLEDKAGIDYTRRQWCEPVPATQEVWQSLAELGITGLLVSEQDDGVVGNITPTQASKEGTTPQVKWMRGALGLIKALRKPTPQWMPPKNDTITAP